MKDLYSFDKDEEGLEQSYKKMYDAYSKIFTRCGLKFRPVEADSGAIGGNASHEFMVLAENGEAALVYCTECDYAANIEIASCKPDVRDNVDLPKDLEKIHTPDKRTIDELTSFLSISPQECLKTLFYQADDQVIAVLIRGDRSINEIKVQKVHPCYNLQLASAEAVWQITGCHPGSVGPVGTHGIPIYADMEVKDLRNAVCGANEESYHLINVNPERDFKVNGYFDLRSIEPGESCPKCNSSLHLARGIEVGQVFKLGTKYSDALNAKFLDENGKEKLIIMGCYGIGVTRTMAATVEQNYDENGIIWPKSIAPYQVIIIPISAKDQEHMQIAESLYRKLLELGIEVVLDDRNERPGVKFKDADLIGIPVRLTIGKKSVTEGLVEFKLRTEEDSSDVALETVDDRILKYFNS